MTGEVKSSDDRSVSNEGQPGRIVKSTSVVDLAAVSPAQRKFRPDVEGLRALAILLVVLFHAGVPGVRGGFIGVDVFFVISGFLITGLLLREESRTGRLSLARFYARRCRRILPVASLMVILTVFAAYHWLGFLEGNSVATDAKWTSLFIANVHFAAIGTNYFSSQAPPSPLQHMWSLSVEEQFYAVWPLLMIVVAATRRRISLRLRLGVTLAMIIVVSFSWSVIETGQNGVWAYFSPFTRAWELAIGGLVAVASPLIIRIPRHVCWIMGFVGFGAVLVCGAVFSSRTPYPGSAVAIPVLGTVFVITAGSSLGGPGVEGILRVRPLQWLGARSYSLYLWHWPILVIAAEYAGKTLPVWKNLLWLLVALGISMVSYRLIENPIRRSKWLGARSVVSIGLGILLIGASLVVAQWELRSHSGANGMRPLPNSVSAPHAAMPNPIDRMGVYDGEKSSS